ncbi:MipA/OmpV family protein [Martelella alba]|uniref:MipA/OmpV family protein n=2 Tax=Martelella alba TaxID=2590451 RepID=A0ABY2SQV4_9HYPH|nr:MipA/OmpV family protein [Martelella alba]
MASDWSLGASAFRSTSPYKGGDERIKPFPVINYDGDSLYIRGLSAGYYLWKDQQNQLSLTVSYLPWGFKPDDDDYGYMKKLDERRSTAMAGISYRYSAEWGIVRGQYLGDILNNSNGFAADLAYLYPFHFQRLTLLPGVGAGWASGKQNDYYFGVSSHEARRSGLEQYQADDGWSPYLEVTALYAVTDNWQAMLMARYTRLSDEVKDSPMVDASSTTLIGAGITYRF